MKISELKDPRTRFIAQQNKVIIDLLTKILKQLQLLNEKTD